MLDQPLVSVIITNYNYAQYLAQAIDSVLSQDYPYVEAVVVDDGSTDNSLEVIEDYRNRIVSVAKQNGGQASAFNAGYEKCSGDIICLLDADDLFLPNKVATIVNLFQSEPDVDWVFVESLPFKNDQLCNEDIKNIYKKLISQDTDYQAKKIDYRASFLSGKTGGFAPSTSNLCFSKKLLEKIFPLPDTKGLSGMAITDLYLKLLSIGLGTGYSTKQNLGIFRVHDNLYTTLDLNEKRRMFGEIYTTTGYWLSVKYPEFNKVSMKLITKGFATYLKSNYMLQPINNADCDKMFSAYMSANSMLHRIQAWLIFSYYTWKLSFKDFV